MPSDWHWQLYAYLQCQPFLCLIVEWGRIASKGCGRAKMTARSHAIARSYVTARSHAAVRSP